MYDPARQVEVWGKPLRYQAKLLSARDLPNEDQAVELPDAGESKSRIIWCWRENPWKRREIKRGK